MRKLLKQIGVRAGTLKGNGMSFVIEFVNKNPIALNMALKRTFPFAVKRVVAAFWWQGLFFNDHAHYFLKFINIHAALFHQHNLLFERLGKSMFQHQLVFRVFLDKVFPHLIKRTVPFCGDFPTRNSHALLNSSDSLSVVARIPRYGVTVRGTDGALAFIVKPIFDATVFGREGKDNRPRWNFARHVNDKPMAGGYFDRLRNTHKENVA
jgi:hypothetical protein